MRQVWLTARYELRATLGRKSFWLTTLLLPAAFLLVVFVADLFSPSDQAQGAAVPAIGVGSQPIGYVDVGGVLHTLPARLPPGTVESYKDEPQAQAALADGKISRYYLIPADYVSSGRLTVVEARYQPLRALKGAELITYVMNTGITGDERLAALLLNPAPGLASSALNPSGARTPDDPLLGRLVPYLLMFILYLALAMTSGYMLQSVSKEKENLTAEMLLVSVRPRDLMLGKIAGLSAVGLLQVVVWLAVFFGVLASKGSIAGIDLNIRAGIAAQAIPWTLAYFLLGYVMYASVYGVLSVLAPTARDANHFVYIAIIPLVVPLLFSGTFSDAPNGALATTLSLVPLTSPIAMVARLGAATIPWWQSLAGLVALGATAYLLVLLAARLFRAENLLSSRALSWGRLTEEFRPQGVGRVAGRIVKVAKHVIGSRRTPGQATSRKGALQKALGAAVLIVFGVVEIVRGESLGFVILVLGIAFGASAFRRGRRD
jgi:ABC-2 type transport system permease protein